jgi:hypothetical protein
VNRPRCCPLVSSMPLDTWIGPEGRGRPDLQVSPLAFGRQRRHETEELSTRGGSHCSQAVDVRGPATRPTSCSGFGPWVAMAAWVCS